MQDNIELYIDGPIKEEHKIQGPYQLGEKGFLLFYSTNQLTKKHQFVSKLNQEEIDALQPADILDMSFLKPFK